MMIPLALQQPLVISIILLLIALLFLEVLKPSYLFFSVSIVFILTGIIGTEDLLDALANESILSIFLLIFITAGLREHFNIVGFLDKLFGKTTKPKSFMLRMTAGVTALSSVLNNTPIVALLMPYVYQWSKKHRVSPSKLLIPLSYAAILGGMITVIGTSTNLVLNGLIESKNATPLGFGHYLIPGLLVSFVGIVFLYFVGYRLLPSRVDAFKNVEKQAREYWVEMKVLPGSSIVGKSITEAQLRNLESVYLFEIMRGNQLITPVEPDEVIQSGDVLFFAGETENIVDLLNRENGLTAATAPNGRVGDANHNLVEAVIPVNSELVGNTLKGLEFRENYDAAVVAIHRNGERLRGKIGEIVMQAGDLLLLSTGSHFEQHAKSKPILYLVSEVSKMKNAKPQAKIGFVTLVILMIIAASLGVISLFLALILITSYMVGTKLLSVSAIKKELDVDLLIVLVASLTMSKAIIDSGTADLVAHHFVQLFSNFGNIGVLVGLYLVTVLLTTFVTNVAAVSIVFPVAFAIGQGIPNLDIAAVFLVISFGASACFHVPFSYQTNLMVYGLGGYKFKDYVKVGGPLTLLYSITALVFIILYYNV